MSLDKGIGATLKRLRLLYGDSAKNFAKELNISASYLSEIENGKKDPSLGLLNKYSQFLGIKLSSIMMMVEDDNHTENKKNMSTKIVGSTMQLILDKMTR